MPTSINEIVRHLGDAALKHDRAGQTDGQLLSRFIENRDEAAVAPLVQRHGPMVWGVCRRVLGNHHDAEDAFQATFIVLVRRAASIAPRERVGNWLYGVANQTARKAKAMRARRQGRERQVIEMPETATKEPSLWDDLQPLLDLELSHLPEKYRLAIVLCDLEGKTRKQAARQLGVPDGTVAARVARGRIMLAKRLARHGLSVSGSALATVLAEKSASACVPASVMSSTIASAGLIATGQTAAGSIVSAKVAALTEGVLKTMLLTKLAKVAGVLLVLGMVGLGGGLFFSQTTAAQEGRDAATGLVLAIAATAGPPEPSKTAAEMNDGEKKPAQRPIPISPGIQALASASTDIVIADVVETNPRRAIEGARDTVKLKVIRPLLGRSTVGDTIGVYYHLLWSDEKRKILESPKFTKGKRYVIFLSSHPLRGPDFERIEFELTDRWVSVLPDHVDLVGEVAAAIRVSHGDSRGEWSSTDGSIAGLQGRLVAYREESVKDGTPNITIYLDLRNTSGGNNSTEFLLDGAKAEWIVSDATGKAIAPISPPGNGRSTDRPRKLILDSQESGRLVLTIGEGVVTPGRAGHLELATEQVWEFARGDKGVHFLAGKITIASSGQPGRWYGRLSLPKVRIPLGE